MMKKKKKEEKELRAAQPYMPPYPTIPPIEMSYCSDSLRFSGELLGEVQSTLHELNCSQVTCLAFLTCCFSGRSVLPRSFSLCPTE